MHSLYIFFSLDDDHSSENVNGIGLKELDTLKQKFAVVKAEIESCDSSGQKSSTYKSLDQRLDSIVDGIEKLKDGPHGKCL